MSKLTATLLTLVSAGLLYVAATTLVDAAYQRGLEHGRQLERNRPQSCPAIDDAMTFWFNGDKRAVYRALNQACKRIKK